MSTDLDNFKRRVDQLCDSHPGELFDYIIGLGENAFRKDSFLYKLKDTDFLEKLIEHFKKTEEYEKCARLQRINWRIKGVI